MHVDTVAIFLVLLLLMGSALNAHNNVIMQQQQRHHGRRHHHIEKQAEKTNRKRVATTTTTPPGGGECCPAVARWVEQKLGVSRDNAILRIYGGGGSPPQRFYEVTCGAGVEGRPCRYVARPLARHSRCVQRYAYTYALVTDFRSPPDDDVPKWRMDYIRIGSGCSCEIETPPH